MLSPRIPRSVPVSQPRVREGDSRVHLAMVGRLPCCLPGCESNSGPPHHLLRVHDGAPKGASRTNPDRWALPVCVGHHVGAPGYTDWIHRHGSDEDWLATQGVNARELANALWSCRNKPDPEEACRRVVFRAKQNGRNG